MMDDVQLLDTSMRVSSGEREGNCFNCEDNMAKRKRMEEFVRRFMIYDEAKRRTLAEFDELVVKETDRRLKATGMEWSQIVAGAISMFKKHCVADPGEIEPEAECDNRDRGCRSVIFAWHNAYNVTHASVMHSSMHK